MISRMGATTTKGVLHELSRIGDRIAEALGERTGVNYDGHPELQRTKSGDSGTQGGISKTLFALGAQSPMPRSRHAWLNQFALARYTPKGELKLMARRSLSTLDLVKNQLRIHHGPNGELPLIVRLLRGTTPTD